MAGLTSEDIGALILGRRARQEPDHPGCGEELLLQGTAGVITHVRPEQCSAAFPSRADGQRPTADEPTLPTSP